jgi:hypothetical protein
LTIVPDPRAAYALDYDAFVAVSPPLSYYSDRLGSKVIPVLELGPIFEYIG